MDQEKIGKFIKELRKKNNLTQKQLADKYQVTYQAVSKWENGKNLPDINLIKQISKDFNIEIESILDGNLTKKKKNILFICFSVLCLFLIVFLIIFLIHRNDNFELKTLSSNCDNFLITGSLAYNNNKTSIYISNIDYCGEETNEKFEKIQCSLYENYQQQETKITTCNFVNDESMTLDEYLKNITFNVDNYERICKHYTKDNLYLEIQAIDKNNKITMYKVPLSVNDNCSN